MATKEEIKQELTKADARLDEATKNLKTFEEGEEDGKWLKKLKRKIDKGKWGEDEGKKGRWEESVRKLEEKKERLEEKERFWRGQVEEWGKKLREFGEEKGNEQIV